REGSRPDGRCVAARRARGPRRSVAGHAHLRGYGRDRADAEPDAEKARLFLGPPGIKPPQHGLRAGIRLLALDAPVLEFLERNRRPGDSTAHERARPDHPEIAVKITDFCLAGGRAMIEAIEHLSNSLLPAGRPTMRDAG